MWLYSGSYNKKLLVAPGTTTRSKGTLLGTKGIATRSKGIAIRSWPTRDRRKVSKYQASDAVQKESLEAVFQEAVCSSLDVDVNNRPSCLVGGAKQPLSGAEPGRL